MKNRTTTMLWCPHRPITLLVVTYRPKMAILLAHLGLTILSYPQDSRIQQIMNDLFCPCLILVAFAALDGIVPQYNAICLGGRVICYILLHTTTSGVTMCLDVNLVQLGFVPCHA